MHSTRFKRYARLSLRWKILLPYLALSLLVSFAGTYMLGRSLQDQVYDQAGDEVRNEADLATRYLEREQVYLVSSLVVSVEEAKLLAGSQQTAGEAMAGMDMSSFMGLLGLGGESAANADLIKVTSPQGEPYFEFHGDMLAGRKLDDAALLTRVLAGESVGQVLTTTDGRGAYLVGATPLPISASESGVLMLGTKIDRAMLSTVGLSGRMLLAYTDEAIVASTDEDFRYGDEAWSTAITSGQDGKIKIGDEDYMVASAPVEVDGQPSRVRLATVMAMGALAAEAGSDWTRTWLIFAAGAFVLIGVGHYLARRLVHPIRLLTAAAARFKTGDFDVRIDATRQDEIGDLAIAFNTMGQELKERDDRLAATFDEVKRLSETDPLTGLLNHRTITEQIEKEVARAHRYGSRFGLMVLDLDGFKLLNDTYGHPVGDRALRWVAQLLVQETREVDSLGRHGGDEFMLIMPECGQAEMAGAAEKLQHVFTQTGFEAPDGNLVPIATSIGVACYPDDGHDANTLIALADANLYLSKSRGGGTVTGAQIADVSYDDVSAFGMLGSLVTIVDNKDRYTRHHSEEVTELSMSTADALGLSDESRRVLRIAGLLHDIGKIGVPDRILRKPGRLSDDEYEVIKQHSMLGDAIIAAIPDLEEIRAAILAHHERYDGRGYPNGLKGDQIPLMGRILAVADAYSAMVTNRPYRKALSREDAIAELVACKGSQFDPDCVDAFLKAITRPERATGKARTEKTEAR